MQKEFDPVSALREEDDPSIATGSDEGKPEEKVKSKEEEKEEDSKSEEKKVPQERARSTVVVDTEDWEDMMRAVVAASARSAFRDGIRIYPDGYWSEDIPSYSSLHQWDCLCTR